MNKDNKETEIKLPIADLNHATRSMKKLNAQIVQKRHFEDNFLFDRLEGDLAKERQLLRIRNMALATPPHREIKTVLTFKGTPQTTDGVKEREEIECDVSGSENLREIFLKLGFRVTFRYQKFRTIYKPPDVDLNICIDETPIGNFYELEGEILRIHEFATQLGYSRDDYITQSYASLYFRWVQKTGSQEPFMIFKS